MNPDKIGRFLTLLMEESESGDGSEAVEMFHYVMMVEAMYLQMMTIYHVHNEDMDALVQQLETFADHAQKLTETMSALLLLDSDNDNFELEPFTYKHINGFGKVCLGSRKKLTQLYCTF